MRVSNRRQARQAALQALYEIEVGKSGIEAAIEGLRANAGLTEPLESFAENLVRGVEEHAAALRGLIEPLLIGWDWSRLAVVDKTILRIAAYELFHRPEIPPAVTLDEAVELAKKFSTAESGKFVNGVLGALLQKSPKAAWVPPETLEDPAPPEAAPPEVEVRDDAPEVAELAKAGLWKVRSGDTSS
jgi:N utilization substance protein B